MHKTLALASLAFLLMISTISWIYIPATIATPTTVTDTYVSDTSDLWWSGATSDNIDSSGYIVPPSDAVWSNAALCWVHQNWNPNLKPDGLKAKLFAEPSANWIWKSYQVTYDESITGDIVFFKKQINIPENAFNVKADLFIITADNAYYFYVNDDWSGVPAGIANFAYNYDPTSFYYTADGTDKSGGTNSVPYETVGNLYPLDVAIPTIVDYWASIEAWDISGLLQNGENWLQIVAINEHAPPQGPTNNPAGLIYKIEVTYELATIEKAVTPDFGYLGDILTVTLDVEVPTGLTMTVEDELPTFLRYILGTFTVDGGSVIPTVEHGVISTEVGEGDHTIIFDVQVIQVEATIEIGTNWAYLIYDDETVAEDSVDITTYPYEGFAKEACLILDGDAYIDLNEDVHWQFTISVTNIYTWTMHDVVVTDNLNAEIEIDDVLYVSTGEFSQKKRGNIKLTWTIGDLEPGETAILVLEISTNKNKKWQRYTSEDDYWLNSGAVLKFIGPNEFQHSAHTPSIGPFHVPGEWPYCVVEEEGVVWPEGGTLSVAYEDLPIGGGNDWDYNDFVVDIDVLATFLVTPLTRDLRQMNFTIRPEAKIAGYTHVMHLAADTFQCDGTYELYSDGVLVGSGVYDDETGIDVVLVPNTGSYPDEVVLTLNFDEFCDWDFPEWDHNKYHGENLFYDPYLYVMNTGEDIHTGDVRMLTVPVDWQWPTPDGNAIWNVYPKVTAGTPPTFCPYWWT